MRRFLAALVAVFLWAGQAEAWDFLTFPNFPQRGSGHTDKIPWWYHGLTFHAPFDNPADPLKLYKGTGSLSFTRETTATYVHPSTGLITVASAGQLRIESSGALLEGERTNLALQSSALGTTWDNTNIIVDTNNATSPDGTANAELLTAFDTNGTIIQDLGEIASAAKVFSVYLKRKTGTGNIDLTLNGGTGWTTVAVTSAWARYSITATLADPDVGIRIVTSGDSVYAYGAQVEAAAFASSLIPTTTAAVTRNMDLLFTTSTPGMLPAVGTCYAEVKFMAENQVAGILTDETQYILANVNVVQTHDLTNTAADGAIGFGTSVNKFASRWGTGGLGITRNGNTPTVASFDGGMGTGALVVGNLGTGFPLYGHVKNLRVWSVYLTDEQMQSLTR